MSEQITTIDFFRYTGFRNRYWAFSLMGMGYRRLTNIPGLEFVRLLGSGAGNGFSIKPNFGVYAILGVWTERSDYNRFEQEQKSVLADCKSRSQSHLHLKLSNTAYHGQWASQQPFRSQTKADKDEPMAVITRATIYPHKLLGFWRYVPSVSKSIENIAGRRLSVGIGEWPLFMQATFSLWDRQQAMLDYAYKNPHHAEVVRKTRELGWYKEEMFARFKVLEVTGDLEAFN